MKEIQLQDSCLSISQLGLGCEPLGGTDWGDVNSEKAMVAVKRAYDLGVTYFDTADVYGLGRSEKLLSQALGSNRHDVVIGTKFGVNWKEPKPGKRAEVFFDSSPKRVMEACEDSLRRLQLDTIPLYFIHAPDPHTHLEETLAALARCIEVGKIKAVGLSNFTAEQISTANKLLDIAAVQLQYNLIDQKAEDEVLQVCEELNISVFVYGALAQGLLTGKYDLETKFGENDRRRRLSKFQPKNMAKNLKVVQKLRLIGEKHGKTPAQVAIRWVLENPVVDCVIVGAKTASQIESNCDVLDWELNNEEMKFLSKNLGE